MTPEQEQLVIDQLKHCADLFLAIRMDWSDPRHECRLGMDGAINAIKTVTGETYTPEWSDDD